MYWRTMKIKWTLSRTTFSVNILLLNVKVEMFSVKKLSENCSFSKFNCANCASEICFLAKLNSKKIAYLDPLFIILFRRFFPFLLWMFIHFMYMRHVLHYNLKLYESSYDRFSRPKSFPTIMDKILKNINTV